MATMAIDNRQQHSPLHGLTYDPLRQGYSLPQFNNPWTTNSTVSSAAAASPPPHMYPTAQDGLSQRPTTMALPFPSLGVSSSPVAQGTTHYLASQSYATSPIDPSQDLKQSYAPQYTTAATSATYLPTSAPAYSTYYAQDRTQYGSYDATGRRPSHPMGVPQRSFSDAIDASRGLIGLSSTDITPRPLYGNGSSRSSTDSYGFPSTHSAHSSISSASSYHPSYYNPSVAESVVSDYSSASESVDLNSRTLPRPMSLISGMSPPAPQSMMGQFSSKITTSTQKKHKCKICDKRFTRPSSLQTHMYSHTGEKPYACEVPGCGRHFSVVSNLRRHRKVHKTEDGSDHQASSHADTEEDEEQ